MDIKVIKIVIVTLLGLILMAENVSAENTDEVESTASIEFLNDAPITPPSPPVILPPNHNGELESGSNCSQLPNDEGTSSEETGDTHKEINTQSNGDYSNENKTQKLGRLPQTGEQVNYLVIIFGAMLVIASGYLYKNLKPVKGES